MKAGSVFRRVVYLGLFLFSISVQPILAQTRLNSASGQVVKDFEILSDSSRVIFRISGTVYSASTSQANMQLRLSDVVGGLTEFFPTPNGDRVVFSQEVPDFHTLYSADPDVAGSFIQLSSRLDGGSGELEPGTFEIVPDGSRVVYLGDLDDAGVYEMYSSSTTAAGTQVKLSTPISGEDVEYPFYITDDSSKVVYHITGASGGLFVASTSTGSTQLQLVPRMVECVSLTPDSARAIFIDNGVLFSQDLAGMGSAVQLNTDAVFGGALSTNSPCLVTPDSSRVVYRGDIISDDVVELFSASTTTASTQIKLNSSPIGGGDVGHQIDLTPDGSRVVYLGDLTTDGSTEIYSASTTAAGTQIKLNSDPTESGGVERFDISFDGNYVVYLSKHRNGNGVVDLFSASTTAEGTELKLATGSVDEPIVDFVIDASSSHVLFIRDGIDGTTKYEIVDLPGSFFPETVIDIPANSNYLSQGYQFTPDSQKIVFSAKLNESGGDTPVYSIDLPAYTTANDHTNDYNNPNNPGDPPASIARPILRVTSKRRVITTRRLVKVTGIARSASERLTLHVRKSNDPRVKRRGIRDDGAWSYTTTTVGKAKRIKLKIWVVDSLGQRSKPKRVLILRR